MAQAGSAGWVRNEYDCGEWIEISATALENYHFVGWSDGSTDATRRIEVSGDAEYTAYFEWAPGKVLLLPNAVSINDWMQMVGLDPDEETSIRVYSSSGQMVGNYTSKDSPTYMLQAQGVSGCYVVKVNSENIKTTLKYVVYAW